LPLLIRRAGASDTLVYLNNTKSAELFEIGLTDSVNFIQLDPENWILKNVQVAFDGGLNALIGLNPEEDFLVYPNPANDVIHFSASQSRGMRLEVYNMLGVLCLEETIGYEQFVDIRSLEKGIYFYKIIGSAKYFSGKIFIE